MNITVHLLFYCVCWLLFDDELLSIFLIMKSVGGDKMRKTNNKTNKKSI